MARFDDLVRSGLDIEGIDVEPQALRLGIDLARLLVRSTGSTLGGAGKIALDAALTARTDLPAEAREVVLKLALSPRFRTALKPEELRAFAGYFGPEAADTLREEQLQDLDLEGFSGRYGTEGALLLLDAFTGIHLP